MLAVNDGFGGAECVADFLTTREALDYHNLLAARLKALVGDVFIC